MAGRQGLAVAAVAAAATVAACGSGAGSGKVTPSGHAGAVTPSGRHVRVTTPGTPKGQQTVHIEVIATSGRPNREAMALVPVYIDGQGPYAFALDTGASTSLIARPLATKLHLRQMGSAGTLHGVTGSARGVKVQIRSWRAGKVGLPAQVIAAIGPKAAAPAQASGPGGAVGLLGSDVLSRYGKIAVDYEHSLLILDPPVK